MRPTSVAADKTPERTTQPPTFTRTGDRVFKLWKDAAGDHWERNNLRFTPGGKRRDCGLAGTGEKLSTWSDLHGVLLA